MTPVIIVFNSVMIETGFADVAQACIGLFKQLYCLANEDSLAHTGCKWCWASWRSCERGLFYLLVSVSFHSEDLKRVHTLSPLGQKRIPWIRTVNLLIVQRNAPSTEPSLQIWHIRMRIIAVIKSNWKKKFTNRKTCWITVWLLANSGTESHNEDMTWEL